MRLDRSHRLRLRNTAGFPSSRRLDGDLALAAGLAGAYAAFAATFRGPRGEFWPRMTRTGVALAGYALAAEPDLRRTRLHVEDLPLGLGAAGVLYGLFRVGDRMARRIVPHGGEQIEDIYSLRELRPKADVALRLGLVIGPAEELFWRGFLQGGLQRRIGRWRGAALAAAAYGAAHLVTGNLTLIGAASAAGSYWSAAAAMGMPMGALIVSHIAWDLWIFLVAPTVAA